MLPCLFASSQNEVYQGSVTDNPYHPSHFPSSVQVCFYIQVYCSMKLFHRNNVGVHLKINHVDHTSDNYNYLMRPASHWTLPYRVPPLSIVQMIHDQEPL